MLTTSILSIQYVQYRVSRTKLRVQAELINTNSYLDGKFLDPASLIQHLDQAR